MSGQIRFDPSNPEYQWAKSICQTLQEAGGEGLFAGGCVRDAILGEVPKDFDVATSLLPDDVEKLFPKTIAVGKSFGVIVVVKDLLQVEVATFRKDGVTADGRRPETVEFTTAKLDASRRDFTVNGLFFDPIRNQLFDYVDGEKDLRSRTLRAIGVAQDRFQEDHLRMLRGVRLAAQLSFTIESGTWKAIVEKKELVQKVSGERIFQELSKLLESEDVGYGLRLLSESGLLAVLVNDGTLRWQEPLLLAERNSPLSHKWLQFAIWISRLHEMPTNLFFFENLFEKWKFSKDLKNSVLRGLYWYFEKQIARDHSLGEVLEASQDPVVYLGLRYYRDRIGGSASEARFFEQLDERRLQIQDWQPWVKAMDLPRDLQGPQIGDALKFCFHSQLEGRAENREGLLELLMKRGAK